MKMGKKKVMASDDADKSEQSYYHTVDIRNTFTRTQWKTVVFFFTKIVLCLHLKNTQTIFFVKYIT